MTDADTRPEWLARLPTAGVRIFPCGPNKAPLVATGFHAATTNLDQISAWWAQHPDALIGVPTGAANDLLVLDIDPAGEAWVAENLEHLSIGRVHHTPRGRHYLYRYPKDRDVRCSSGKLAPGVDIRGAGGYVIFWPAEGLDAQDDYLARGDASDWLLAEIADASTSTPHTPGLAEIPAGSRNDTLFRLGCELRGQGNHDDAELLGALHQINAGQCKPALSSDEVAKIAASIVEKYPAALDGIELPAGTAITKGVPVGMAPEPLRRELGEQKPYPVDALGPLLDAVVCETYSVVRAPLSLCAQSYLAAAAVCVQPHIDVVLEGRLIPAMLNLVTIGETGIRKSAVDRLAVFPVVLQQRELQKSYELDRGTHAYQLDVWKEHRKVALKEDRSFDEDPPIQPMKPTILVADATFEGLFKQLRDAQPSAGLINSEAGTFIGGWAMNSDNQTRTLAALSKLWDQGECDRSRGGDEGTTLLWGRRVTTHLMMQPIVANDLLGNELALQQGYLSRTLVAWPEPMAGKRAFVDRDLSASAAYQAYKARADEWLGVALPIPDETTHALVPGQVQLTGAAKQLWIRFHDLCDLETVAGGQWDYVGGLANKAPEHAIRIAAVLSKFHKEPLSSEWIARGIQLATWYLDEAARVYGVTAVSAEIRHAETLLVWWRTHGHRQTHTRHICQYGPGSMRTADQAKAAMALLVKHGYADVLPPGTEIDGAARAYAWELRDEF